MVFSSAIFLFIFLPILLFIYYVINPKYRNIVLLIASLLFYAWGEPKNVFLMLLSIVVNYYIGILIEYSRNKQKIRVDKVLLIVSIVYNLGMLFVFKYLNFTIDTFNRFTNANISIERIALPIGISFYTFQILSYVIDVYLGAVEVQKKVLNLALYVSFFPQLIAGPIVRYIDIEKQIANRYIDSKRMWEGIRRFIIGFSKKILIADQLSPFVDVAFSGAYHSIFLNWVGIVAYTLQIYFDFSGYSDMAIGLGKMFGFEFLENFNYPYISQSIQEFWRRWHISLSSWFRDYLYIPLGGSRCGNVRTYVNLIIVFFMTGLWHGASFNFIIWGLFYVVFLIIERLGFKNILMKLPKCLKHIYALSVIMIAWVFFRADSLTSALYYIKDLFVIQGNDYVTFAYVFNRRYLVCIIIGILLSVPCEKLIRKINSNSASEFIFNMLLIIIFVLAICFMIGSGYSPFLYFRF